MESNLEGLEETPSSVEVLPDNAPEDKDVTLKQSRLDELIRTKQGAAGRAAREEAAALKAEVARLKAQVVAGSPDSTEVEKLRASISLEQQRASAAEARADAQAKSALQSRLGNAIGAVDPESVAKLLADRIIMRDGKPVTLDESGVETPDVTVEQLYKSWGEAHPWAIKGSVITGIGQGGSVGSRPPESLKPEQVFGRTSSSKTASELMRRSPAEYKRLKAEAISRGIL